MPSISITIPSNFTQEHASVVLKYFETAGNLASEDWKIAFSAFDKLAYAKINWKKRQISFTDYYKKVSDTYADKFISALLEAERISETAYRLQTEVSRKILSHLQEERLYSADVEGSQFLAAYCLYWWNSFARGYSFEIEVYRKLDAASVVYTAHDLLSKTERLLPYDLIILGKRGDIKNTTYFLHSSRTLPLQKDFYITRVWQKEDNRYILVVILNLKMWEQINGKTLFSALEEASHFFPNPVATKIEEETWVVIPLHVFLKKVRQKQIEED